MSLAKILLAFCFRQGCSLHCSFLGVLQAAAVPVQFEEHHLSEVQNMASEEKLEEVLNSMKRSKVAIIGRDLGWS